MLKYQHVIIIKEQPGKLTLLFERRENSEVKLPAFRLSAYIIKVKLCAQVAQNFSKPASGFPAKLMQNRVAMILQCLTFVLWG